MWKLNKPFLRYFLLEEDEVTQTTDDLVGTHVLGYGVLLHRIYWQNGNKHSNIAEAYISYLGINYDSTYIVFDRMEMQVQSYLIRF